MGKRLNHFKNSLDKLAHLPGPSTYNPNPTDYSLSNTRYDRSTMLKSTLSRGVRNDIGTSFIKANDRWVAPTEKVQGPPPGQYNISGQFKSELITHRRGGFGSAKQS